MYKSRSFSLFVITFLFISDASASVSGWTQRADFGSHGRHRGVGIAIGTKGYMGLGHFNGAGPNIVLKDWWEYDPSNGTWTQKADYIGNGGNGTYAPLTFGMNDFGFIGGGQVASSTAFYKYDPTTNLWTPVSNSPTLSQNQKAFAIGNIGYYLEGSQLYEYNGDTDVWTTKNMAPFGGGLWNSTFVIDGKGYYKEGSSFWEYKPTTDQWASRAFFPGLATRGSVGFSQHSKGYIVCGYGIGLSDVQSETWEFDPTLNQWTQLLDFPGTKRRFGSGFNIGNRSYLGIGTNGTNFNDFWEFNSNEVYASLSENMKDMSILAYPNPATDQVQFTSETLKQFDIKIYNITGKLIATISSSNGSVNFLRETISSGAYLYQVIHKRTIIHQERIIFN